ncbi:MAG: tRNA (adenosine(37)-N6)-dimethylallyltransferase MiaA [Desulfohalobiaceae bacterium]|nr:tRNA (adenosine(37)-N6)-dimethylallyltransferase MiaA [Desulfohalobiaceae bacterium]
MRTVCLIGPTGTGKSSSALEVAEKFGGEIVNFDSRQVYGDVPLTTDQPGPKKRERAPHWLYGFLDPWDKVDAGGFAQLAEEVMQGIARRGAIPVLTGGTGLYLRAILYGLAPIPKVPDTLRERILREYDERGPRASHSRLAEIDPETASAVSPGDRQRVSRALEVFEHTGRSITWWRKRYQRDQPRHAALKIGLNPDRQQLRKAQEERIETMLEQGALEEVRAAWRRCPDPEAPIWTGIGCRELLNHVRGGMGLEEAKRQWAKRTWDYAKRQLTWFRKDRDVIWVNPGNAKDIQERVALWLASRKHSA